LRSRAFLRNFAMESLRHNAEGFGLARHCAGFSMSRRGEKKKACIFAGLLALGSPVDHLGSYFRPASVAMFSLSGCFTSLCPIGVLVKLAGGS
jgi:hypothetical protein